MPWLAPLLWWPLLAAAAGDALQPRAATLSITIDPAQAQHRGTLSVDLTLARPQPALWLHARDLQLGPAHVEVGAHRLALAVHRLDADRVQLKPARALAAGPLRLTVEFSGRSQPSEATGLQRHSVDGRWWALARLQAQGARRLFPLIDEPGWKLPWTLTLTVPDGLGAVANSPLADKAPADLAGWQSWRFAPTPPLSGHQLAFAVGPFDTDAPAGRGASATWPLRALGAQGSGGDAASAAARVSGLVGRIESSLGAPYPFAKLDLLAWPAVESAIDGLSAPGLLVWPAQRMPGADLLARQWFGGLVGLAAWEEAWLPDALAGWLGEQAGGEGRSTPHRPWPSQRHGQQRDRTPMPMLQAWLGPERLLAVLQRLIERHAWGQASVSDFQAALGQADPRLRAALQTALARPDLPRVRMSLQCAPGTAARVRLEQAPALPSMPPALQTSSTSPSGTQKAAPGPAAETSPAPLAPLPVLLRTPSGVHRMWLDGAEAVRDLPDAGCPAWLVPNADGLGWYRSRLAPEALAALAASTETSEGDLAGLVDDLAASHQAGELAMPELLAVVQGLARQARREATEAAIELLLGLRPLVSAAVGPMPSATGAPASAQAYAALWQQSLGTRARALGWLPRPEDNDDDRRLRARLVPLVAEWGQDSALRELARVLVQGWLAGRHELPPAMREALLASAAQQGDAALFERALAQLEARPAGAEARAWWRVLGHFRAPALAERARERLLDPRVDLAQALPALLGAQVADADQRAAALDFLAQYQRALARRLPAGSAAQWPGLFSLGCSAADAERLQRRLGASVVIDAGGHPALAQALDAVQRCTAWRTQQGALPAALN